MVMPIYSITSFDQVNEKEVQNIMKTILQKVQDMLPRIHSIVMGPGLGRHPNVMNITSQILKLCKEKKMPIVIDADGLWMVNQHLYIFMTTMTSSSRRSSSGSNDNSHIVLTPNLAEFNRLYDATLKTHLINSKNTLKNIDDDENINHFNDDDVHLSKKPKRIEGIENNNFDCIPDTLLPMASKLSEVSKILGGVTILLKGSIDLISNGSCTIALVGEEGSPRRCGGMGDILSGTIGTFLHWTTTSKGNNNSIQTDDVEQSYAAVTPAMWSCWAGCVVTKRTAQKAFAVHKRSTTAPDLLDHIGEVGESLFPTS
mmetsp:Transcript_33840/g.43627  ORF Transcript_33840/g.43627 Transcript_33840/m.43627 type:complete len:314 (+) Transcript_33840:485-1426(+)